MGGVRGKREVERDGVQWSGYRKREEGKMEARWSNGLS
jgi:hypothetical protein